MIVLDDFGVKNILILCIFKFVLYRKETGFAWSNAEFFEGGFAGYVSGFRLWGFDGQGRRKMVLLNKISTNLDEAIKFIISKLPEEKLNKKLLIKSKIIEVLVL